MYFAHSGEFSNKDLWQLLKIHLQNVAAKSQKFLMQSGFKEAAYVQGLLHDAGKYALAFQHKLDGENVRVDHATAGAKIALEKYGGIGKLIAYAICGHHGGLPDGIDAGFGNARSSLCARIKMQTEPINGFWDEIELPDVLEVEKMNPTGFQLAFYARMLFSALVDADYLDTEAYYSPEIIVQRSKWADIKQLEQKFRISISGKQEKAEKTPINGKRKEIYEDCLRAAEYQTGLFSLTVPTGGGKTLSSMAFALKHALIHDLKRIIYAIPFTSIIEQNAAVFREALGDNAVLEHHSNYDFENAEEGAERFAAENWNAPVIVTTNVQLFESLFSNKPSRCRKLHNLAHSIIILDEMQTLPDGLLKPCLAALQCLCNDFGVTVVLCTATQPAIDQVWPEPANVREIISNPAKLYEAFRKVDVHNLGKIDDTELAGRINEYRQVLCIVNTRRHARILYQMLPKSESIFHLSALMCPEHRTLALKTIRKRLNDGLPCKVISTQLIEAGVDVDFPVVYRSAAGIDSIAQAAGRCNREGKLKRGETFVFFPSEGLPKGWFQRMATLGGEIINSGMDPLGTAAVREFFLRRYMDAGRNGLDEYEILRQCKDGMRSLDFPFEQIAKEFQFIQSAGKQIIVPFDDHCREILYRTESDGHPWRFTRTLQRYTITVYPYEYEQLFKMSLLKEIGKTFIVLDSDSPGYRDIYNNKIGLNIEPEMEVLVV